MTETLPSQMLKIATFYYKGNYEPNTLILNYDGTPMKDVFQAAMIRLLAKGLGVTFNIVTPDDNTFGSLKPDGKSTGLKGMIERGEADLSVSGFTMSEKNLEAFPFTYPLLVTDFTFMTNKLEPHPKWFAIFAVFPLEIWLSIALFLILVSFFLYFLLKSSESFSTILFASIGCLLEQPFSFEVRQRNTVLLLLFWFIGVTFLTASYKSVILSIMTAPKMIGIRHVSDLSKAVKENSCKCFTWPGGWMLSERSSEDKFNIIAECIIKSISEGLCGMEAFHNYSYKKAFLGERVEIIKYNRYYYVSDDSIRINFIGIPYSRNFCCPQKLETVVHRIVAAGLYEKILNDQDFTAQMRLPKELGNTEENRGFLPLKLEDLSSAFIILFVGHVFSLFVLIAEILFKKRHYLINDRKCIKILSPYDICLQE